MQHARLDGFERDEQDPILDRLNAIMGADHHHGPRHQNPWQEMGPQDHGMDPGHGPPPHPHMDQDLKWESGPEERYPELAEMEFLGHHGPGRHGPPHRGRDGPPPHHENGPFAGPPMSDEGPRHPPPHHNGPNHEGHGPPGQDRPAPHRNGPNHHGRGPPRPDHGPFDGPQEDPFGGPLDGPFNGRHDGLPPRRFGLPPHHPPPRHRHPRFRHQQNLELDQFLANEFPPPKETEDDEEQKGPLVEIEGFYGLRPEIGFGPVKAPNTQELRFVKPIGDEANEIAPQDTFNELPNTEELVEIDKRISAELKLQQPIITGGEFQESPSTENKEENRPLSPEEQPDQDEPITIDELSHPEEITPNNQETAQADVQGQEMEKGQNVELSVEKEEQVVSDNTEAEMTMMRRMMMGGGENRMEGDVMDEGARQNGPQMMIMDRAPMVEPAPRPQIADILNERDPANFLRMMGEIQRTDEHELHRMKRRMRRDTLAAAGGAMASAGEHHSIQGAAAAAGTVSKVEARHGNVAVAAKTQAESEWKGEKHAEFGQKEEEEQAEVAGKEEDWKERVEEQPKEGFEEPMEAAEGQEQPKNEGIGGQEFGEQFHEPQKEENAQQPSKNRSPFGNEAVVSLVRKVLSDAGK